MSRVTIANRPALVRFLAARRVHRVGQFGQADDTTTADGKTACTHVCLQLIIYLWTGRWLSLDTISGIAGYPSQYGRSPAYLRGLLPSEVERVLRYFKLPYKIVFGKPIEDVIRAARLAPAMVGVRYLDYPRRKGLAYKGARARPIYAEVGGHDQLSGFDGAHMTVLGGDLPQYLGDEVVGYDAYMLEPNHPRPGAAVGEYDIISTSQLRVAYEAMRTLQVVQHGQVKSRATYAVIPTRALPTEVPWTA